MFYFELKCITPCMCTFWQYICIFCIFISLVLWIDLKKSMYEKSAFSLRHSLTVLRWPCVIWQDVRITNLQHCTMGLLQCFCFSGERAELQSMLWGLWSPDSSVQSRVQSTDSSVQSTGSSVQSTGSSVQSRVHSTGGSVQSTGSRVQSTDSSVQSTGSSVQSTGSSVQSTGSSVQSTGSRVQS